MCMWTYWDVWGRNGMYGDGLVYGLGKCVYLYLCGSMVVGWGR